MQLSLRAHVRNGRLVLDEPTDLPEGTEVELTLADDVDDLDDEQRARLHEAIAASRAEIERGERVSVEDVRKRLRLP